MGSQQNKQVPSGAGNTCFEVFLHTKNSYKRIWNFRRKYFLNYGGKS
jgi:hypothetical protein